MHCSWSVATRKWTKVWLLLSSLHEHHVKSISTIVNSHSNTCGQHKLRKWGPSPQQCLRSTTDWDQQMQSNEIIYSHSDHWHPIRGDGETKEYGDTLGSEARSVGLYCSTIAAVHLLLWGSQSLAFVCLSFHQLLATRVPLISAKSIKYLRWLLF